MRYSWRVDGDPAGHLPFCANPGAHPSGSTYCTASPEEPQTMNGEPSKAFIDDHQEVHQ